MKITLEKLEIINFKGIKNLVIEFKNETTISADNGIGKTTISDCLPFLLFGKNAEDQTKFGAKTYDENGIVIPHLDHIVKGWFDIDGTKEVLERHIVENWVKKHGETRKVYEGDVIKLYINAAPKKKGEFDAFVGNLVSGGLFKLLSNPMEFNRMPWEKRRSALISMAGEIKTDEILDTLITPKNKGEYLGLINILNSGKLLETEKSELKGKISMLKKDETELPGRIAEVDHNKPQAQNWDELGSDLILKKEKVKDIEKQLFDESEKYQNLSKKEQEKNTQINNLKLQLQQLESDLKLDANKVVNENKTKANNIQSGIYSAKSKIKTNCEKILIDKNLIKQTELELPKLREEFASISLSEFVFDDSKSICPTCKQSLPEEEIEESKAEMLGNFNENKANKLAENQKTGKEKAERIKSLNKRIEDARAENEKFEIYLTKTEKDLDGLNLIEKEIDFTLNVEWNKISSQIAEIEKSKKEIKSDSNQDLQNKRTELNAEIEQLTKSISDKELIESADKRILELKEKQTNIAQQIADYEQHESVILQFEKTKMDMLENRVNGLFHMVKFRMFEPQKNGGEKPDCITLINGVPYNDANLGSKVNAGIDIINVLSDHYNIYVPIVVDNRESVSEILPVKSQVINLFKVKGQKILKVE